MHEGGRQGGPVHQAYISEIFSSIQGEGLLVGLRQLFVRFSGCSLTCDYCDTPESRVRHPECKIIRASGSSTFPNPVSPEKLNEIINSFQTHHNLHHSISLTGGEPLEQVEFLKEWLPSGKGMERGAARIYLETNGLLPGHLSEVLELIDIIGMDIKLPSVSGVKPLWNLHRDFLRIASEREVFVKVVVDKKVAEADMERAVDIVESVDPEISLVLQPRTPVDIDSSFLFHLQEVATRRLYNVRVVPQVHKLLNIL